MKIRFFNKETGRIIDPRYFHVVDGDGHVHLLHQSAKGEFTISSEDNVVWEVINEETK